MPFTIPDKSEGANDIQSIFFQEYLDILVAGIQGVDCVIAGLAVTAQGSPDMTVAVASGSVNTNGVFKAVTGANATIGAADATNPRLDLVVINSAGAIAVRAGTAATNPKPAAKSANDVVLAVVYVPATDTTISTNQITDLRMVRSLSGAPNVPVPLADAATVLIDASLGHSFTHEGSVGRIMDGPTGGYNGQRIVLESKNTGGSPITHTLDVTGANSFRYPPGFNALQPIPAGVVVNYVAKFHLADAKWDVLGDSLGASTTAAGTSGEVQYNNAGTVGGAANVEVEGGNLKLVSTADPAAPTGGILLYSKLIAGRHLPKIIGPSGIDTMMQVGLHGNSVFMVAPASGTTAPTQTGGTLTTAATMSLQQTIASANPWLATARKRFQTSGTAGNSSGMRTAYAQWFRGNAAGFGGFWFRAQFGQNINLNGGQKFVGLCASTAVLASTAGAVAALINMCGVGHDTTDASTGNWFFYRNDGTGTATKVDLGATDAARNTTHGYDLIMFMAPNGSDLFVRIVNLHSGVVVLDTSYNTDLPAVNTGMAFKAEVNNGAVAAANNLEVAKVYIETDY